MSAVGVGLSPRMLTQVPDGLLTYVADVTWLPFADRSFAGMWASESLVHMPAQTAAASPAEMFRVVSRGGALFASVKTDDGDVDPHTGRASKGRLFTLWTTDGFIAAVQVAGFRSVEAVAGVDHRPSGQVGWIGVFATRPVD